MKFKNKPVTIEAIQFTGEDNLKEVLEFAEKSQSVTIPSRKPGVAPTIFITIPTLEGDMRASVGDWIIRGVQGEYYSCKPDIFEATYEEVSE